MQIAYLSGKQCKEKEEKINGITFDFDTLKNLKTEATAKPKIDILITSQWPDAVCNYAKTPVSNYLNLFKKGPS